MLSMRMRHGLPAGEVPAAAVLQDLAERGLIDPIDLAAGRLVLTRAGRLLADGVVRALID